MSSKRDTVVSVRLPSELKHRLDALSASTGRSSAFYVRQALSEHLDELEHAYSLRAEAEAARRGEVQVAILAEVLDNLGLTGDTQPRDP